MARCENCGRESGTISKTLGLCRDCIQSDSIEVKNTLSSIHRKIRESYGLPGSRPHRDPGIRCTLCINECVLGEGETGLCGLRVVRNGRIRHKGGVPSRGLVSFRSDSLPTNCVASWVCDGSKQRGKRSLAVFYQSCTANCIYCQNWEFKEVDTTEASGMTYRELVSETTDETFCVCFFGGDPASQMPFALAAAREFARRGIRVCWETNGTMHPRLLEKAMEISLETRGCMKMDLKALDDSLHRALTGISNTGILENFRRAAGLAAQRSDPPALIASTLLVPGYVGKEQVEKITSFIATVDQTIPYTMLAYSPSFYMKDLPYTSVEEAETSLAAAHKSGLQRIHIGNHHLIGWKRG